MSIYTYVTTLQPPTAVHEAIRGNFLSAEDTNLIVSKGTRIEVYSFSQDLLFPVIDFNLYCRIASIKACKLPDQSLCSLFVLSEQQTYCVLQYDPISKSIVTITNGTLEQKNARPNDEIFTALDTDNRAVVVSAFTGLLCVIPLQGRPPPTAKGKAKDVGYTGEPFESYDTRIQEFSIKSMTAVECTTAPTFAILYDREDGPHIKFYQVKLPSRTVAEVYAVKGPVETSCHLLIPVPKPYGGVLSVGEYTISYFDMNGNDVVHSIDAVMITAYEFIGGENKLRCVLGDTMGLLYLVSFRTAKTQVTDLHVQFLGDASVCSSIVYLGFNMLYLGSSQGDSSLVQISSSGSRSILKIIDQYANLAPITDFCLYDLDKQGIKTMVCCSGANNDGSLRVVQSGVGFLERAAIPIDGVQQIWSLRTAAVTDKSMHDMLVLSTIRSTRILYHPPGSGNTMEELDAFAAFDLRNPTLATSNLANGDFVQITPLTVRYMKNQLNVYTAKNWSPPPSVSIVMGAIGLSYCVISCGFGRLVSIKLNTDSFELTEVTNIELEHEVSCIDILESPTDGKSYVAVGCWGGKSIQILDLHTLSLVNSSILSDAVPRSVLFQTLQDKQYLFVTLGDGKLVVYSLDSAMTLSQPTTVTLGTRSSSLFSFSNSDGNVVFAASDRPTVINSVRNHLVYSAVNLKDVKGFAVFNNRTWRKSLVMLTDQAILLGDLDRVRKLHVFKLPLEKKMGRRIAYHDESQTIVVGTSRLIRNPDNGDEQKVGWVNIYDARTLQETDVHELFEYELVESICVAPVFKEKQSYVFIGTAITLPSEPQRSVGRILMYQVISGRNYQLVDAVNVPGVVYCIKPYRNSIIAAVNGSLYYLDAFRPEAEKGEKINMTQKIHSNVLALDLDTKGDTVLVGDFMQSMSLLKMDYHDPPNMSITGVDFNANWMTAVKMMDDDTYVGAEMSHNLFTLKRPIQGTESAANDPVRLDVVGEFHIGDLINRMHDGSFADEADIITEETKRTRIMYVTVNGAIGIMTGLSEENYELLCEVQRNLLALAPPIGNMDYTSWRTFNNGTRAGTARNYIDGDLLEKFLALSTAQQEKVVKSLPISVEELQTKIENLSQTR